MLRVSPREGEFAGLQGAGAAVSAAVLAALLLLAGCPAHTNYGGPQRLTDHTAYTLPTGEGLVGVGLVGTQMDDLIASVRLEWSPYVPGLEIGTNLAHDVLPLLNIYAKYTILDTRWVGLGARIGVKWLNVSKLWMLPNDSELKRDLAGVDMVMLPVSVALSLPLTDWFGLHTELIYTFTPVSGELVLDDVHYNAGVVWHEVSISPALHFYPGAGVALLLGVHLPLYSAVRGEGYQESPAPGLPGVRYGIQASLSTTFDVRHLVTPWFGVHIAWEHFNLRVTGTWGLRFFDKSMFSSAGAMAYLPLPGFEMFWRF